MRCRFSWGNRLLVQASMDALQKGCIYRVRARASSCKRSITCNGALCLQRFASLFHGPLSPLCWIDGLPVVCPSLSNGKQRPAVVRVPYQTQAHKVTPSRAHITQRSWTTMSARRVSCSLSLPTSLVLAVLVAQTRGPRTAQKSNESRKTCLPRRVVDVNNHDAARR